jgi:hypothetical protein
MRFQVRALHQSSGGVVAMQIEAVTEEGVRGRENYMKSLHAIRRTLIHLATG